MMTTPIVPAVGTSGRATPLAAPIQPNVGSGTPQRPRAPETNRPVLAVEAPDRAGRYIAEREHAMRARLAEQLAEAADEETAAAEPLQDQETGPEQRVQAIDLLPPPATEVLAKGGKQSRLEARAELFEAEARLRMLEKASAGYQDSRSAIG